MNSFEELTRDIDTAVKALKRAERVPMPTNGTNKTGDVPKCYECERPLRTKKELREDGLCCPCRFKRAVMELEPHIKPHPPGKCWACDRERERRAAKRAATQRKKTSS